MRVYKFFILALLGVLSLSKVHAQTCTIYGNTAVCPGETTQYEIPGNSTRVSWAVTGGGAINGSALTRVITITWSTPGQYLLEASDIQNGGDCSILITVRGGQTTGTISSANGLVCDGNTDVLTLSGYVGSIVRWEKSTTGVSNWVAINHTQATYTAGPITQNTYYRVLINGYCASQSYTGTTMLEFADKNPGSISVTGTSAFCSGESTTIALNWSGPDGTLKGYEKNEKVNGQWSSWTSASVQVNSSGQSLIVISKETMLRARVLKDNGCGFVYTSPVYITESQPTVAGAVTGPSQVCPNQAFSLGLSGNVGSVVNWYSKDEMHDWHTIGGVQNIIVERNTQFKATVKNASCATIKETPVFSTTVQTVSGDINSEDLFFCQAGDFAIMVSGSSATSIQWERKVGNGNWLSFGQTGSTLAVSGLQTTTRYRAKLSNSCYSIYTKEVEVFIDTAPPLPIVSSPVYACPGAEAVLATSNSPQSEQTPVIFHWYIKKPDNTYLEKGISGENEWTVRDLESSTTYYVAFEVGKCTGPKAAINIVLSAAPEPAKPYAVVQHEPYRVTLNKNNVDNEAITYYWQDDINDFKTANSASTFSPTTGGVYFVRGRSNKGCWSDLSEPVEVPDFSIPVTSYSLQRVNMVREYVPQVGSTLTAFPANLESESDADKLWVNAMYFDGYGRPAQSVAKAGSPEKNDIITPTQYDPGGRIVREHLPYVAGEGTGTIKATPFVDQATFYSGSNHADHAMSPFPYGYVQSERSPLDRPAKLGAPGQSWQPVLSEEFKSDRTLKQVYSGNTADEVYMLTVDENGQVVKAGNSAFYTKGSLQKKVTLDEQNNEIVDYTDVAGKIVLRKVQVNSTPIIYAETYYLYDDLGRLVMVLPPEASKEILPTIPVN